MFTLVFSISMVAAAAVINSAPAVTINSPANNASFVKGAAISFSGTANDTQDGNLASKIEWVSSWEGSLGRGSTLSTASLRVGTHTITARVPDSNGLYGLAKVSITVKESTTTTTVNSAPIVTINSPANNASFVKGAAISFSGAASDAQDGAITSKIIWDHDGTIGTGGSFSVPLSTAGLTVGTHTITAKVTDSKGLSGLDSVTITVKESTTATTTATTTVPTTYYNVVNYGAKGSDTLDDTAAIQKAINYVYTLGGGTVYIPDGTYYINTSISVKPKSNVKLKLTANATLKAIPNSSAYGDIVNFSGVSNSEIDGGNIVGDRYKHTGTTGEWGMGIRVNSSNNIRVANVKVSDCWGDGIIVDGLLTTQPYSRNVMIESFVANNNRRNNITVISAKGLTIRNGTLSNANGTKPQSGIDIEPDSSKNLVQDILIENMKIINNIGYGVDWWFYHLIPSTNNVTIKVNNCTVTGNVRGNIRFDSGFGSTEANYKYLDITINGRQIGSGGV